MDQDASAAAGDRALESAVRARFGVLPNFFRLAPGSPDINANLWKFAVFAYLDNPLPSLFKERLFVHLSRFCEARYCIVRHVGFLLGLGRPAGDADTAPESVEEVLRLIRWPMPRGEELRPHLELLESGPAPLEEVPEPGSRLERALFACASHVFLQTLQAQQSQETLQRAFGTRRFQSLLLLLTFIRTAHYWTRLHPELGYEDDVSQLLATHEVLAECVLSDRDAGTDEMSKILLDERATLRRERALREALERVVHTLREREDQLREQDRRKDEFLAMLGHELRNPLSAIASAAQVLQLAGAQDAQASVAPAIITRQVDRMTRIVNDLLDLSRVTTGRVELSRQPLDLARLVEASLEDLRASGHLSDHELRADLASVWVDADGDRIDQIVSNLVGNGVKHTPPGGRIDVRVRPSGAQAVLEVEDNGSGILPELLPRIFDLFVQGERSIDRSGGGLGIGLTLVKRLLDLHGGSVTAASDGAGRGARFAVHLPAIAAPAPIPDREAPAETESEGRKILVIEDNEDARKPFLLSLALQGHEVLEAADGVSGLALALETRPDVVLVDIGLPGLDGYEVGRRLRATSGGSGFVLIALTGYGQAESRQRALAAGFDEHLVKPVSPAHLAQVIEATCASSAREPIA